MLTEKLEAVPVWEQIVECAKERIPEICPYWTDFNVHDPGMALVELLAWLHEIQLFHMEQISDEHYKKYLKLLGMKRNRRRSGRTLITVSGGSPVLIPAGTRFYAGDIQFESGKPQMTAEGIFDRFVSRSGGEETVLSGEWVREGKGLSLWPFGHSPQEGAEFTVAFTVPLAEKKNWRLYVDCESRYPVPVKRVCEEAFDGHGFYPMADIRLEYRSVRGWELVKLAADETCHFIQSGSICFSLEEPMSREQPQLRFVLKRCGYLIAPCITRISLAMVEVRQQETLKEERRCMGTGLPDQQFDLQERQLLQEELLVQVEEHDGFSGKTVGGKPGMTAWTQVEDFDCSGPEDRHYRIEDGILSFGDGWRGMMPEGLILVSRLRRTLGEEGNVKAGAVSSVELEAVTVTNEQDVTEGRGDESFEQAMERYYRERKPCDRAVSKEDYERLIRLIPGLLIEDCRVTEVSAKYNRLTIAVKPYAEDGQGKLNHACETNIYRFLEEKRLIGTRIQLVSPEYCRVSVRLEVVGRVEYPNAGDILKKLIREWIEEKTFGEGIAYAEFYGLMDTHPCVSKVKALRLDSTGRIKRNDRGDLLIPANGLMKLADLECMVLTETERTG